MLVRPSSVNLSTRTLRYLTGQLRLRGRAIGARWRRLTAGRQALLAPARLRCGDTYAQLAAGSGIGIGIGIATVYRCVREAVHALAELARSVAEAMRTASAKAFVILDGTLPPIDRIAADTPYCSGKHKRHGMNVQVLTDPFGRLLWASPALSGSTHDLTATRTHGILDALAEGEPDPDRHTVADHRHRPRTTAGPRRPRGAPFPPHCARVTAEFRSVTADMPAVSARPSMHSRGGPSVAHG
ncbi:hypothetical protein GCM10018987_19210 [Streptomyces cremeus]